MSEVRLTPAALVLWLALLAHGPGAVAVMAAAVGVALIFRQPGQAILLVGVGVAAAVRARAAGSFTHATAAWSGFAETITRNFADAVSRHAGPSSQGLIPGMVLGDVSAQSVYERQTYVMTGLSHLSAVSGANISVVATAALLLTRAFGLGPKWQVAAALGTMALFVSVVGPDPSVLRATVTGAVGLAAVVASARMQPIHALSLAVIFLLLCQPALATDFGFALSVGATLGIIALNPPIFRALAPLGMPEILTRAIAVAIAADVTTMPLVAAMTGRVSLVSIVSNVLVAPATVPVTIGGLVAVVLAQVGLAAPVIWLISSFTWWISQVAQAAATVPLATVSATPLVVAVAYGWVIFGLTGSYPRRTLAGLAAVAVAALALTSPPARLDNVITVATVADIPDDCTADAIIVTAPGEPHDRPVRTPLGVPVLFPQRDGPVRVARDGTQHGNFYTR